MTSSCHSVKSIVLLLLLSCASPVTSSDFYFDAPLTPSNCQLPPQSKNSYIRPYSEMLLDHNHKIIMDWSTKAACTKMIEMFWNEMNITRGVYYPEDAFVHEYRYKFYAKCGSVKREMFYGPSDQHYYKFKVVRNPFSRAVSSFLQVMRFKVLVSSKLKRTDGTNGTERVHTPIADATFEEYLELCKRMLPDFDRSEPNFAYRAFLVHSEAQSSKDEIDRYLDKENSAPPLFHRIVHLENFEEEIAWVNQDTHMNYSFPPSSDKLEVHVSHKESQVDEYRGDWKFSDLISKHGLPEDYGKFYNRKTKMLVERIYHYDFVLYNYSYPFTKLY